MKKIIYPFFIAWILLVLFGAQASGFSVSNNVLCVNDDFDLGFDFQAALNSVDETNNEVRLISGTYNIANSSSGHFNITADHSLTISGGWNADCSVQTIDPDLTILQGGANQVQNAGGVL
ncbi:MAG: hypothetical protein R3297_11495, partial [Desulfobulbales bacterium]|nr:hypothetical protein [Desulfobulbales bacterium]